MSARVSSCLHVPPLTRAHAITSQAAVVLLVTLVFLTFALREATAQSFAITAITRDGPGTFALRYGSDTNAYYLLLRGASISNVTTPARMALGVNGIAEFGSLPGSASTTFYRIRRISLLEPLDTDGDGLDDVTELRSGFWNPLDPTDRFTTIRQSSPASGESDVAVTRETVLDFSLPLSDSTVLTTNRVYATYGNRRLLSRVELSTDKRKATLFYLEPLPGSTRISVVFDGNGLTDFLGRPIDADGDGVPGGTAVIRFDTLGLTPIPSTAVIGRVFASEPVQGSGTTNFINRPLAGVTITVDGREQELRTVTDAEGRFKLQPVPAGRFFVHVDGRTALGSQWPNGNYYPFIGKAWEAVAGQETNLAGGNGVIYLPLIIQGTLQPVSMTTNTVITFPASVVSNNPAMAGVSIIVPANSLFSDTGARGGRVGIAPVPPDRLPEPLPPGLNLPIVITLQTDGPSNFDRPVPVRFPNLPDPVTGLRLPPDSKSALWSFNHDTGRWEIVGPMTVTADGQFVDTDPGVGIRQPGWHGSQPGVGGGGGGLGGGCGGGGGSGGGAGENCRPNPNWNPNEHYNGCGPDTESGAGDYLVPDNPNVIPCASFYDACKQHDIGYGTCGKPKSQTDSQFLQDMLEACGCLIVFPPEYAACQARAFAYYAAVSLGGGGAYEAGQQQACICDPPPPPPGCEGDSPAAGPRAFTTAQMLRAMQTSPPPTQNGTVPPPGPLVPQFGTHYFAIYNVTTGQVVQRGRIEYSGGGAFPQLILAANTTYRILVLQESTLFEGWAEITTGPSGTRLEFPTVFVRNPTSWDLDGDGLHDAGELILGSNPSDTDTDDDGINDATEARLGLNPLGAAPVATGVIASTDTPGTAVDVSALNDLVAVADSSAGVAIFDARGINPIIASQVDTPGSAQRVAWGGSMIAVADGPSGLAIIDASDPSNARLIQQVPVGNVTAVATAAGLAYAGLQSGHVAVVDLTSGVVLERIAVGAAVHDLAIEGGTLFVLLPGELRSFSMVASRLEPADAIATSGFPPEGITGTKRLFVGGGVAYVTSYPGFDTINVSDPADMRLLGSAVDRGANSFKQIVANGSGLGLAAVGVNPRNDGTHDVYVYDLTVPTDTTRLVTTFVTPDIARAVSVFNGLAYVADSAAGLQVVNYRSFDVQQQPPSISLSADFPLSPAQAEEGKSVRVTAMVTDDVQVRNVEFYIDGVLSVIDGNFPFEHRFITPQRSGSISNFTIRAVAFDTGGNRAETLLITVQLVPDATPPRLVGQTPDRGQIVGSTDTIAAFFSEPIDPGTLSGATFVLTFAGPDDVIGNADDSIVTGGTLEYRSALNGAFLTFPSALAPGIYRPSVRPPIADLAGNPLARELHWDFLVLGSADADLDGVPDNVEDLMGLNPNNPDSDGDGILDGDEDPDSDGLRTSWELAYGLDPRVNDTNGNGVADGAEDPDNDRLTNQQEQLARTNPARSDTDGDGWSDEAEVSGQGDPLDPNIGPRLFLAAAPPVRTLVTGPNLTEAIQLGTVVARPPTTILATGPGDLSTVTLGMVVARPPLSVLVSGVGVLDSVSLGTVAAHPPVALLAPGPGPLESISLGIAIARPPVMVLSTGVGALELLNSLGTLIAQPPLNVLVPGTGPDSDVLSGTTLALPPVNVRINPE